MRLSWKLQSPHWVDDGDFNKNGKKAIGLDWQNNNSAGVSRSFVHFIAVTAWQGKRIRFAKQQFWECITLFCTFLCRHCKTTTWKCLISRFVEEMHDNDFLFPFPERQLAHFRVPPGHLYQNEVKFWTFDIEMMFHSQANTTHFHKKDYALGLILKVRIFETRKWPILLYKNSNIWRMDRDGISTIKFDVTFLVTFSYPSPSLLLKLPHNWNCASVFALSLWKSARARCASFLPHSGVTWKTLSNTNRFYFFVAFSESINYSVNYQ